MPALETPTISLDTPAIDFSLLATDGRSYSLADCRDDKGMLLMFICNHCPYVKSIIDDLVRVSRQLRANNIGVAAICSNDADTYPEDSFERMGQFAQDHDFCFPYLHDPSQRTARDYGAVCTPDFFGYNADLALQYRGRFDDRGIARTQGGNNDLLDAMLQIAKNGQGPDTQYPSIGCSIKWKNS